MVFLIFIIVVGVQRLTELFIAKRNEQWMKSRGGVEFGASHYPWMVAMHIGFFAALILENVFLNRGVSDLWPLWLGLFFAAQAGRIWALSSLGKFWNTKIIVLPNARVVAKGPYKWMKHPNYVIVAAEIIVISLLFNAYLTAIVFTVLNYFMMRVRIPLEEKALKSLTEYEAVFKSPNS
ncbi:isoprenylcysteine carboxyl methyltransferase family protein [Peribacillus sp. B-H-3]|uniref:isoprenylcysteine carboxyl methyltransferase family protein n=1 Tax=Peribacillus sp. B-H-3 TaxID=3400420 RepID=UPI003B0127E9